MALKEHAFLCEKADKNRQLGPSRLVWWLGGGRVPSLLKELPPAAWHSQKDPLHTNKYILCLVMLSSGKQNKTGKGDFISNGQRRLCDDSCVHHSDTEVYKSIISIRTEPWGLVGPCSAGPQQKFGFSGGAE